VTAGVAEATWRIASVVHVPPNYSMQQTALRAAADEVIAAGPATDPGRFHSVREKTTGDAPENQDAN